MFDSWKQKVYEKSKQLKTKLDTAGVISEVVDSVSKIPSKIVSSNEDTVKPKYSSGAVSPSNVVQCSIETQGQDETDMDEETRLKELENLKKNVPGSSYAFHQQQQTINIICRIETLFLSGKEIEINLADSRQLIEKEVQAEQQLFQSLPQLSIVKQSLVSLRIDVELLAEDMEDFEDLLLQHEKKYTEQEVVKKTQKNRKIMENIRKQKARELKHQKLNEHKERRRALSRAFQKDMEAYRTLVTYHGWESVPLIDSSQEGTSLEKLVTLENIELNEERLHSADLLNDFYADINQEETEDEIENKPDIVQKLITDEQSRE